MRGDENGKKDIFNYIFEYKPFVNIIDTAVFEGISCGVNYFTSTTDRRQFNLMRIQCPLNINRGSEPLSLYLLTVS